MFLGLGLESKELTFIQVSVRGIIVFIASLVMVRVAHKRFLSKMSAFDVILGFILASMLARAVNGSSAFFPTIGGGFVLVGLHRLLAALACRWRGFEGVIKGATNVLVQDGKPNQETMRLHKITRNDLLEEARLNGQVSEMEQIKLATLERNGQVSILPVKK